MALDLCVVALGWTHLPDLTGAPSRDDVEASCRAAYPDKQALTIANWARQVWAFKGKMQKGDLVMVPQRNHTDFAVGTIIGPYHYRSDLPSAMRHARPVRWMMPPLPRAALDQDILYSLGSILTVCRIQRNDAEERVRAVLAARPPDGKEV